MSQNFTLYVPPDSQKRAPGHAAAGSPGGHPSPGPARGPSAVVPAWLLLFDLLKPMNFEHVFATDTVLEEQVLCGETRLAKQLPTCRAGRKCLPSVWQSLGRRWPDRHEPSAKVNIATLQDLILEGESTLLRTHVPLGAQFGLRPEHLRPHTPRRGGQDTDDRKSLKVSHNHPFTRVAWPVDTLNPILVLASNLQSTEFRKMFSDRDRRTRFPAVLWGAAAAPTLRHREHLLDTDHTARPPPLSGARPGVNPHRPFSSL